MDIVTGHVGSAHVTSWQDRDLNQGIFGPGSYILNVGSKLAATIITNNEIHIADGVLVVQGCQGVVQKGTYDTISIDNGTAGMKRNDLICAEYTKVGGVESLGWTVIKGTPAASNPSDPSYTSGDIQNGDTPVQVPVYRVNINGLTVEGIVRLVDEAGNISEGGTVTNYTGTATLQSRTGWNYNTVHSELLPEGTYLASFWIRVEDDIPTLANSVEANYASFRGDPVYYGQYDVRCAVTAFFTLNTAATVYFRARQGSGSSVSAPYGITLKKVG